MGTYDNVANALMGFGAGVQGNGMQFIQQLKQKQLQDKLSGLSQLQDPGAILKGVITADPTSSNLAAYAHYMAEQKKPTAPATQGLPDGYMWKNGQAAPIPGITPKSPAPLSPEAKLATDLKAGLIDEDTYKRGLAKQLAPLEKNYKQPQLQAASFADRMAKSEELLQPLEASGVNMVNQTSSILSKVPLAGDYLENATLSDDQQLYKNASTEWIRAKLRKESGAAIGKDEMEKEFRTYFPMPGDSAKVILQKAEMRKNNTASMIKQASGAYEEQYLGETPGQTSTAPAMSPAAGKVIIFDAKGNIVK